MSRATLGEVLAALTAACPFQGSLLLRCLPTAALYAGSLAEWNFTTFRTLNLSSNAIKGTLPDTVGSVWTSMTLLDLSTNNLTGSLPPGVLTLPARSICCCQRSNKSETFALKLSHPAHLTHTTCYE